MRERAGAWVFVLLSVCVGGAWAADTPTVKADNKAAFESVAAAVREQLKPGGRWEYASNLEKEQVNRRLDDMQALFDRFDAVGQMDDPAKVRLFNDQEAVNEILTKRDDQHLVCTQEMSTGSHIPKRVCRTYAEIRREQALGQSNLRNEQQTGMTQKMGCKALGGGC